MKRFFVLLTLLVASSAFSQSIIDVVPNEEYVGGFYYGAIGVSKVVSWTAYLDGIRLTEGDFYIKTNDSIAFEDYRVRRRNMWIYLGAGSIAGIAGLAAFSSTNTDTKNIGFYSMIAGGGLLAVSLSFYYPARPLPYAQRLAEAYNKSK